MKRIKDNIRLWVQVLFSALTNGYVIGFIEGKVYSGKLKQMCVPGLNCYSCPGALGSCPIGSLQAVLGHRSGRFPFFVVGFLMVIGALCGRFVCGWLCPFGLVQDLLYRIGGKKLKKRKNLWGHRYLKYLKYVILAVFVVALPIISMRLGEIGEPWFCKWICPSGTLMGGVPLMILDGKVRAAAGGLFIMKVLILVGISLLSVWVYRPFCKYLCPLGAIYGWFNPIALNRYHLDAMKCTHCKTCREVCPMGVVPDVKPNSAECIRCQKCMKACPTGAITSLMKERASSFPEKDG